MTPRTRIILGLAAILVGYALMFARTVEHDFVWDDVLEIQANPMFDAPLAEGLFHTQTERTDPGVTQVASLKLPYDSYRPLLFASYWVDIQLFGRSAAALHAINCVLGAIAILLAWLVARQWLGRDAVGPALVATAVFALHPVQVETIAYISARGDLLAGLFALLATYGALRGGRWSIASGVAFAASLLSKEAYLALPVAIAVVLWSRGELRARWRLPVALVGVVIAYLVVRSQIVTGTSGGVIGPALVQSPAVWLEYVKVALLPFSSSIFRLHDPSLVLVGWVVVGVAALATAYVIWKKLPVPQPVRVAAAGVAWLVLLVGPSAIVVVMFATVADRYAYLPMFGAGIALAQLLAIAKMRAIVRGVLAVWAVLALIVAWAYVPAWESNETLYTQAVVMEPDSWRSHYSVAFLSIDRGDWDTAIAELQRARALDPDNGRVLNNLGVAYLRTQRWAEAAATLGHAARVNPGDFRAIYNYGLAQIFNGKPELGCKAIRAAAQINPTYAPARIDAERRCPQH